MAKRSDSMRITITFSDAAVAWLGHTADQLGITLAELIRRIIDESRGAYIVPPRRQEDRDAA